MHSNYQTVDTYISTFPPNIQQVLERIRNVVRKELPKAEECISYQMPAYRVKGKTYPIIYFAAFKKHIGLFFAPTEEVYRKFEYELSSYKKSKAGIQIPLGKEIDYELIRKIVRLKNSK